MRFGNDNFYILSEIINPLFSNLFKGLPGCVFKSGRGGKRNAKEKKQCSACDNLRYHPASPGTARPCGVADALGC